MFGSNLSSPDYLSTDKILTYTAKNAFPIINTAPNVTIRGNNDNYSIKIEADNVKIDGNDKITNSSSKSTLNGGVGDDFIKNSGSLSKINVERLQLKLQVIFSPIR